MMKLNFRTTACAVGALWMVTGLTLLAQDTGTFTALHSFDERDGARPYAGLVQATDGNLYGTTSDGGLYGLGTVFRISTAGYFTTLHSFCAEGGCPDGDTPVAGLIQATDGNLYGTTAYGGNLTGGAYGSGTIFRITPGGTLTTVYSFCARTDCFDGYQPEAGLIQARDGNLYGTTHDGGTGLGTAFKVTLGGTLTTLHDFCSQTDCTDGDYPSGLIQASNGHFLGTTNSDGANGYGTVFELASDGTLSTLYNFCAKLYCKDGAFPLSPLVQGSDGNFYGTTNAGGFYGAGTVFRITPAGMFSSLYSFCRACATGERLSAALIQATDGNLYGVTNSGGRYKAGIIFQMTPSGGLTTLYDFCSQPSCTDGGTPYGGLVQDTDGDFYGTTWLGGLHDGGTVFKLSLGLAPFVKTNPISGKAGAMLKILGTDLTGATSVTFNGAPATFIVESATCIKAVVPVSATTGPVQVETPSGTLTSNVNFQVLP